MKEEKKVWREVINSIQATDKDSYKPLIIRFTDQGIKKTSIGTCSPFKKIICIHRDNYKTPNMSYTDETLTLLHEFGHLNLCKGMSKKLSRSGFNYNLTYKEQPWTTLKEEVLAWREGYNFFLKLNLKMSLSYFIYFSFIYFMQSTLCLLGYFDNSFYYSNRMIEEKLALPELLIDRAINLILIALITFLITRGLLHFII